MHAVSDQLDRDAGVFHQRPDCSRVTVMQWSHRIRQVGCDGGTGLNRELRLLVVGVGVANRDDCTRPQDLVDRLNRTWQLWSNRHHLDSTAANCEELANLCTIGCTQQCGVMRATVQSAQPWAFEVNTEQDVLVHERRERANLLRQRLTRSSHQAGHDRRSAVPQVQFSRSERLGSIGCNERIAPTAMAVLINETRNQRATTQVEVDRLVRFADSAIDDEFSLNLNPTGLDQTLVSDHSATCKNRHAFLPTSAHARGDTTSAPPYGASGPTACCAMWGWTASLVVIRTSSGCSRCGPRVKGPQVSHVWVFSIGRTLAF